MAKKLSRPRLVPLRIACIVKIDRRLPARSMYRRKVPALRYIFFRKPEATVQGRQVIDDTSPFYLGKGKDRPILRYDLPPVNKVVRSRIHSDRCDLERTIGGDHRHTLPVEHKLEGIPGYIDVKEIRFNIHASIDHAAKPLVPFLFSAEVGCKIGEHTTPDLV